jgi:hypothetical protein
MTAGEFGRVVEASCRFFEMFLGVNVLFKYGTIMEYNMRANGTDVSEVLVVMIDTSNCEFIHIADTENGIGIVVFVILFLDFGG